MSRIVEIFDEKKGIPRKYDLENPLDMIRFTAREQFVWPGGFELAIITTDGGLVCSECCIENYRQMLEDTKDECNSGWMAEHMINESECDNERCDHCNKPFGHQLKD